MDRSDIKNKVLDNPLLKYVLEQIEDPKEKEKTVRAINGLLDEIQGKTDGLIRSHSMERSKKPEER